MNNQFSRKAGIVLSLVVVGNLTAGCRGDLNAVSGTSASTVDAGAGSVTQTGTVSNDGFWVKPYFDPAKPSSVYKFYLHEQNSAYGSASCKVTSSSTNKDLYCYLDVNELDLFFNGTSLVFNAPVGMCEYTSLILYSFYILPAGYYSPPPITISKDASGAITGVTFTAGGAVPASGNTAVPLNGTQTAPACPFDYTDTGGPNCCEGNYTVTVSQAGAGTAPGTTTVTKGSFGGKISNCIAGPGKDYKTGGNGYPVEEITRTALSGANKLVSVTGPVIKTNSDGSTFAGNAYLANYFNPSSFGYGGAPGWPVPKANWPRAISGIFSPAMTAFVKTKTYTFADGYSYMTSPGSLNPYYEYGCLDQDREYLARIRLFVNSWDTLAGWTATSNPYTVGAETTFPEYNNHDFATWQDILNGFPGLSL